MVGAGSVGSTSAYFLPRFGFRGQADVVDPDKVEVENLDRSPLFEVQHDGHAKAAVTADYLRERGVPAKAHPCTWNEFVQKNPDSLRTHDAWLQPQPARSLKCLDCRRIDPPVV